MSIKLRLALLLGLLLLVFIFGLLALHQMERRQRADTLAAAQREDAYHVASWLELRSAPLQRFTEDLANGLRQQLFPTGDVAHTAEVREILQDQLPLYGADAVWIAAADGLLLHSARSPGRPPLALPIPVDQQPGLAKRGASPLSYFHLTEAGLAEVHARRLEVESGPWIFVARIWDWAYLARLGDLTDGDVDLAPPDATGIAASLRGPGSNDEQTGPIIVQRTLVGWDGKPVKNLRVVRQGPDMSFRVDTERLNARVFLIFGLCLIGSLAVSLHQWVLRPLGWIADSLSRHDTKPIHPLIRSKTELTRVAQLIISSFEHREQLRREVAERKHAEQILKETLEENARLGRDLHDGVIQSIYAAGLGIAAARKRVAEDPEKAESHLAHVAATLNQTIQEVRDFITGLEPEAPDNQLFTESAERLFATMNGDGSARADIEIDEDLAARLPMSLRADLLLLLREAISNALRHGGAGRVRIRLARDDDPAPSARLEIGDDGAGFDPRSVKRGRGLDNLFARAAARGAQARLDTAPGLGTRLYFTWPMPTDEEDDESFAPSPAATTTAPAVPAHART